MDFDTIMRFLNGPTLIGFLIIFVVLGGYLGWYVYGPAHKSEVKAITDRAQAAERNAADWQEIAVQNSDLAKQAVANNEVMMGLIRAFTTRNGGRSG